MVVSPNLARRIQRYCNELMNKPSNNNIYIKVNMSKSTNSIYVRFLTKDLLGNELKKTFRLSDHPSNSDIKSKIVGKNTSFSFIKRKINKTLYILKKDRVKKMLN